MPNYKMLVLSQPKPGRDAEYNDWYQHQHLAQVVAIPGIVSARRFRFARSLNDTPASPYAAIYEIETDDIDAVLHELRTRAGGESLVVSDALATEFTSATVYEEFGAAVAG